MHIRANDLACELTNEFLIKERTKSKFRTCTLLAILFVEEWNQVSKICGAKETEDEKFDYTPLCKWGNDQAKGFGQLRV